MINFNARVIALLITYVLITNLWLCVLNACKLGYLLLKRVIICRFVLVKEWACNCNRVCISNSIWIFSRMICIWSLKFVKIAIFSLNKCQQKYYTIHAMAPSLLQIRHICGQCHGACEIIFANSYYSWRNMACCWKKSVCAPLNAVMMPRCVMYGNFKKWQISYAGNPAIYELLRNSVMRRHFHTSRIFRENRKNAVHYELIRETFSGINFDSKWVMHTKATFNLHTNISLSHMQNTHSTTTLAHNWIASHERFMINDNRARGH